MLLILSFALVFGSCFDGLNSNNEDVTISQPGDLTIDVSTSKSNIKTFEEVNVKCVIENSSRCSDCTVPATEGIVEIGFTQTYSTQRDNYTTVDEVEFNVPELESGAAQVDDMPVKFNQAGFYWVMFRCNTNNQTESNTANNTDSVIIEVTD